MQVQTSSYFPLVPLCLPRIILNMTRIVIPLCNKLENVITKNAA